MVHFFFEQELIDLLVKTGTTLSFEGLELIIQNYMHYSFANFQYQLKLLDHIFNTYPINYNGRSLVYMCLNIHPLLDLVLKYDPLMKLDGGAQYLRHLDNFHLVTDRQKTAKPIVKKHQLRIGKKCFRDGMIGERNRIPKETRILNTKKRAICKAKLKCMSHNVLNHTTRRQEQPKHITDHALFDINLIDEILLFIYHLVYK
jgi:hypothetical protein